MLRAAAAVVAIIIAVFLGVMMVRFFGDDTPARYALPSPSGCEPAYRGGGFRPNNPGSAEEAVTFALSEARALNVCNEPDAETAEATATTWDTARETIRARGGFIPSQVPDDHTRVWLVEMRGEFVPFDPEEPAPGPSATPIAGTYFAIFPLPYGGVFADVVPDAP